MKNNRTGYLYIAYILALCFFNDAFAKSAVTEVSLTNRIEIPENHATFLTYDTENKPTVISVPRPSYVYPTNCNNPDFQKVFEPIFPGIFTSSCPQKRILKFDEKNKLIWEYKYHSADESVIGVSTNGIVMYDPVKSFITILEYDTGKIIARIRSSPLECKEWFSTGFYNKQANTLYTYCLDGNLKEMDISTQEPSIVFQGKSQFFTNMKVTINNILVDKTTHYLIFSETMPSRLKSWGAFGVYDLRKRQMIYERKVYKWSWYPLIAFGKDNRFSMAYHCFDQSQKKYDLCVTTYQIEDK